jgi:hypothetical protein
VVGGLDGPLIAGFDVHGLERGPAHNFEPTASSCSSRHAPAVPYKIEWLHSGLYLDASPCALLPLESTSVN